MKFLYASLMSLSIVVSCAAAFCKDASTPSAAPTPNAIVTPGKASTPDKGTITRELHELRNSLKEIRRDARSLLDEYNRSDVRILEFGDFMNQYLDDKPVPFQEQLYQYGMGNYGNTGIVQGPPLPPRKDWVNHYLDSIQKVTALAKQEMNDVVAAFPEGSNGLAATCSGLITQLAAAGEKLESLRDAQGDKKLCQQLVGELIDNISQLDLSAKKMVRENFHQSP